MDILQPSSPSLSTSTPPPCSVDLRDAARRSDSELAEWSDAQLARAIDRYQRFLLLTAKDIRRPVAPTRDIDMMWHLHMLSPKAYFADCMRLFGELLDHDGGFGKGEGELPRLVAVFEETAERWQDQYGEPYVEDEAPTDCWHDCVGRCWHACASDK